ncbi:hypothetical protein [Cryptosporangium sp. NPDC051539]|uniref:hypothetical protein n=1 Tax=Cryptosporangium sp. NPDC051539 TaxID=3363962 RepID=UPI0037B85E19
MCAAAITLAATTFISDDHGEFPRAPKASASRTPTDVELAGTRLPVSHTAGPRVLDSGLARGFSHSAEGAAYAALHLSIRVTPEVGPDVYGPTLSTQVVGNDVAALRAVVDEEYSRLRENYDVPYGRPAGSVRATALGYQVDAVDEHAAAVRLLLEALDANNDSGLVTFAIQLTWFHNDWALVAPAHGDWSPMVGRVYSRIGYTSFADA